MLHFVSRLLGAAHPRVVTDSAKATLAKAFGVLLWGACAFTLPSNAQTLASAVVSTPQLRAELVVHAPQGVQAGQPMWVGLQLTHKPEWHTYWKNPGDSGLPTQLMWTLPPGVEAGDIILRFEGKAIERASDLPRLVGNTKPGSRVGLTVFRRGASKDLNITVAEVQPDKALAQKSTEDRKSSAAAPLGLVVGELSDAQKRELRVRGGVRIESAAEPAARAGLREGDVILAIANTEVLGVRDFEAAMARVDKTRPVSLLIRRGEVAQYVLVRPAR